MEITCIYGLKTSDELWVSRFYPVRRLREEFAKLKAGFLALLPENAHAALARLAEKVREYSACGIQEKSFFPVCMLRGKLSDSVLSAACKTGALCINAPSALKKAEDKLTIARLLALQGMPAPLAIPAPARKGSVAEHAFILGELCKKEGIAFPAVIKPRFGSRGEGVRLAESPEDAAQYICGRRRAFSAEEFIIQEYLALSRGRDVRVFTVGGRALVAAERKNSLCAAEKGEIRSNAAAGGSFCPLSKEALLNWDFLKNVSERISLSFGLFYAAVDFVFRSETELAVCEVNGSPGFEAFERCTGFNVAGALAKAIVDYSRAMRAAFQ